MKSKVLKSLFQLTMLLLYVIPASWGQFTENEKQLLAGDLVQLAAARSGAVCYIQTNKGIYETGEDLWFKAYLLDERELIPFGADTTLYVQVVPLHGGAPVLQEKILLLNGFGSGRFYVPDSLNEGDYYLQAVSPHSYLGQREIKSLHKITITRSIIPSVKADPIFDRQQFSATDSIGLNITLKNRSGSGLQKVLVHASLEREGRIIQSLETTTDYTGHARLLFKPADSLSGMIVRIEARTKTGSLGSPVILPVPCKPLRLQFYMFPEGGYLVNGLQGTLAFKATDEQGAPVTVSGMLQEDGHPLLKLTTVYDGMGRIAFTPVKNRQYTIRLDAPYVDSSYAVKDISQEGLMLSFRGRTAKGYAFMVTRQAGDTATTVFLRIQQRATIYNVAKARLTDSVTIVLPATELPQGIAEVTLFNAALKPICERLIYVNPERKLNIRVDSLLPAIGSRQRQQLSVKITDQNGKPVIAHLGVSVYDTLYTNGRDGKNILSHYYLDNEIKGSIYNPASYFNERNAGRLEAFDLLLLTQGWRRYLWAEPEMKALNGRSIIENNITGSIAVYQRKKKLSGPFFTLFFAPENNDYKSFIQPDSPGNFIVSPYDLASANSGYVYARVTAPEGADVTVKFTNPFESINQLLKTAELSYPRMSQRAIKYEIPLSTFTERALLLPEVVVKARTTRQFRDKYVGYLDSLTKADLTGDYIGVPHSDSVTYRTNNVVYTMNNPATTQEYRRKPIEGKTYRILYYKGQRIDHANHNGGAVVFDETRTIVYHYPKFTEEELLKKYNMGRVKGYNMPREFFSPDYGSNEAVQSVSPDYRNALYWKPDVITDENGEAVIQFYSSDISSGFTCIIEGASGNGLLGSHQLTFKVKAK